MLLRRDAIAIVLDCLTARDLVVFANGFISREGYGYRDRPQHFYMLGSMGLAGAIGLGVALAQPTARVVVLDGDGNLLMGMGVLPMVGAWQPQHFLHVVLDNGTYGSTGSQATLASKVRVAAVADGCSYCRAASVSTAQAIQEHVMAWQDQVGPSLLHIQVSAQEPGTGPRVEPDPPMIAHRFSDAVREATS